MDIGIPTLNIKILCESNPLNPLKSRILVQRLAVLWARGGREAVHIFSGAFGERGFGQGGRGVRRSDAFSGQESRLFYSFSDRTNNNKTAQHRQQYTDNCLVPSLGAAPAEGGRVLRSPLALEPLFPVPLNIHHESAPAERVLSPTGT